VGHGVKKGFSRATHEGAIFVVKEGTGYRTKKNRRGTYGGERGAGGGTRLLLGVSGNAVWGEGGTAGAIRDWGDWSTWLQ